MFKSARNLFHAATIALVLGASAAHAQEAAGGGADTLDPKTDDWVMVGGGVLYGPTYSGSDENEAFFGAAAMGRVAGFRISPRVAGIAVDLIRDDTKSVDLALGPVVRARFDRTSSDLKNSVVESLGKLDTAVELGVNAGVGFNEVMNGYDRLDVGVDVRWDVASAHKGMIISPAVAYQTPLSQGIALQMVLSADYWNGKVSRYYWSVSPAQAVASGLPAYDADDGFNSVSLLGMGVIDLDGNLQNGGFSAFIGAGYQRLTGSAKNSPITRLEGDPDQFYAGVGVGYNFF